MYELTEPYMTGHLNVGDGHAIYYELGGNPDGIPALFLHGGPGGGFAAESRCLFNPEIYKIICFDQRGAGRSKPFASIAHNTIGHLIRDIEKLRLHLDVDRWLVVGGSWGSALTMLYATNHMDRVTGLIVSGVSLADPGGVAWLTEEGGASRLMPDWFAPYRDFIPAEKRIHGLSKAYYDILMHGADDDPLVIEAAKRFDVWDTSLLRHNIRTDMIDHIEDNPEKSLALARIFFHFVLHEYKDGNKWHILDTARRMGHIPCHIVHGRYDLICPAENAWALHKAYPNSQLTIVTDAGHSIHQKTMSAVVASITDDWASFLS